MGDYKVLFVFSDESDVDKVLLGERWSFDKNLVALKKVRRHTEVKGSGGATCIHYKKCGF